MKTLPTPADNLDGVPPQGSQHPTFREAFRFWLKLGFISFGGPTGKIEVMHAELVEKKKWISEARFLHALNYCMLLPGPGTAIGDLCWLAAAQDLAVWL